MVEKRFDIFTIDNYRKVVGRMKELILNSQEYLIENEFGKATNALWENSGNFFDFNLASELSPLDVIHIYSNNCYNNGAYLFLYGDIENGKVELHYLKTNDNEPFKVGEYHNIEDLVKQLNIEYESLVYLDNLFEKIENIKSNEDIEKLEFLNNIYKTEINKKYLFDNLSTFLEAHINNKSRVEDVQEKQYILEKLKEIAKIK